MAWLQAASFGISALGHVLNRTGGRKKVKATLADTSFIEDEVDTIRQRQSEMSNNMLRTANAGVGFADQTRNRMGSALGVGSFNSMLDGARIGALENSYNASLNAEAMNQGQINQLMGQRANLEAFNANAQNQAAATNFQAQRSDVNNIFGAAQAGMLSFANARYDQNRFNQSMGIQNRQMDFQERMWNQWQMSQNPNAGSNGVPLPRVPYQSPNF